MTAARITVAFAGHAQTHGLVELWGAARQLAADTRLPGSPLFVAVQGAAAQAAFLLGELDAAERYIAAGRQAAAEAAGPVEPGWWCDAAANIVALFRGDHARAERLAQQALSTADSPLWQVILLGDIVLARLYRGALASASDALPAVVRRAREVGCPTGLAWARFLEGEVRLASDPLGAVTSLREAVALARSVGTVYVEGVALVSLLSAAVRTGDRLVAVATFLDAVRHWQRSGMWVQQWTTLRLLAELLVDLGIAEPAAALLGAGAADPDAPLVSGADVDRARAVRAALDGCLGPADAARLHARGSALTRQDVLDLALDVALPAAAAAVR